MNIQELLKERKMMPLYTVKNTAECEPLGRALVEGNVPFVEVAYRSSLASEGLRQFSKVEGLIAGAGTIINECQAEEAIACGAKFIVTPGLSEDVIRTAQKHRIPVFPGVATATEVITALSYGLTDIKFFPAEQMGGISGIKALHGPFSQCCFIPSGGVGLSNYKEYQSLDYVLAVSGSFILPKDMLAAEDWEHIVQFLKTL